MYNYYKKLKKINRVFANDVLKCPVCHRPKKCIILYKLANFFNIKEIIGYANTVFYNNGMKKFLNIMMRMSTIQIIRN